MSTDENPRPVRYVIWSEEHGAWWNPNAAGYTRSLAEAGRYSEKAAKLIEKEANLGPNYDRKFNEIALPDPLP